MKPFTRLARGVIPVGTARRVCGWATQVGQLPGDGDRNPYRQQLHFSNTSLEPVYGLVAYLVWVQGAASRTGEETERSGEAGRMRAIVQVLPTGRFRLSVEGPDNWVQAGQLGLEIAFTDPEGRHWVRRVPSGNLAPLSAAPIEHYQISLPLTYNDIEPF